MMMMIKNKMIFKTWNLAGTDLLWFALKLLEMLVALLALKICEHVFKK